MYEKLNQYFMEMSENIDFSKTTQVTKDNVTQFLNDTFSKWSFKITNVISIKDQPFMTGTLLFPGHSIDGSGSNEYEIMCNIINKVFNNSTVTKQNNDNASTKAQNDSKITSNDVMKQLADVQAKVQNKDKEDATQTANENILNGFMNSDTEEKKDVVSFDSKEAEEFEESWNNYLENKEKPQEEEEKARTYTPEEVNPNRQPISWDKENGKMMKEWMAENGIANQDQLSSWLMRFCGLDYPMFNPAFTKQFILWTKSLREKQTY